MIVPATAAHAPALAVIHGAAFPPAEAWGPDAMELQLAVPGAFGLIDPAGGMILARTAADEAEILTLAVAPEARRRGVASALLSAAMARAEAAGAAAMFLEVGQSNAAARALYARFGFIQVGHRKNYYPGGAGALVLRTELTRGATQPT